MQDELLDKALTQAITAFNTLPENNIQHLPLIDNALMLYALPDLPGLADVRMRLAKHLRNQVSSPWIQDGDIYEIFSVLVGLWMYDPAYVTGGQLTAAIRRLVKSEVAVGGPYYSNDVVTIPANIQIAIFMRFVASPLPNLDAFLDRVVTTRHFDTTTLDGTVQLYLLARARTSPELLRYITDHWQQKDWRAPYQKAVAITILHGRSQSSEIERALAVICKKQQADGLWGSKTTKLGARLVASSLIIEALNHQTHHRSKSPPQDQLRRHRAIARAAKQLFRSRAEPLRSSALAMINQVCNADKNFEITLLPQLFNLSLRLPVSITSQKYTTLGLASLFGWIAYTIYDDFLDNEGNPTQLPIANVCLRASLDCFNASLPRRIDFHQLVTRVFTEMDEANAWEATHCRFTIEGSKITILRLPNYGSCSVLATRSFAHALTPIAILAHRKVVSTHIESAFRHYLIARQLNDDMQDWLKDVHAGQASYVVTAILRDMRAKPGTYNLSMLSSEMQRRFRLMTMPKVCKRTLRHIAMSRQAFAKSKLLQATNDIYLLLDNLEVSVRRSLDTHSKASAFSKISNI